MGLHGETALKKEQSVEKKRLYIAAPDNGFAPVLRLLPLMSYTKSAIYYGIQ